jgi:hypothetical protein
VPVGAAHAGAGVRRSADRAKRDQARCVRGREEKAAERTTPQAPQGLGGGKSHFPATPPGGGNRRNPPPPQPTPSLPFHLLLVTSH